MFNLFSLINRDHITFCKPVHYGTDECLIGHSPAFCNPFELFKSRRLRGTPGDGWHGLKARATRNFLLLIVTQGQGACARGMRYRMLVVEGPVRAHGRNFQDAGGCWLCTTLGDVRHGLKARATQIKIFICK